MKSALLLTIFSSFFSVALAQVQNQNTQVSEVQERQRERIESERKLHGRQEQQDEYSDEEDFREDQLHEDANFIEEDFDR
jgi:hypothetical protein